MDGDPGSLGCECCIERAGMAESGAAPFGGPRLRAVAICSSIDTQVAARCDGGIAISCKR